MNLIAETHMARTAAATRRLPAAAAALLCVSALCASAAAQTQSAPSSDGPLAAAAKALNLKTDVGPMPDFVEKSRPSPDSLHYMPIGGARAEPTGRQLTVDQIKAEEAELDALSQRHDRIAGRKNAPASHVSVADGRKPPKAKPKKPKCILTCDVMAIPKPGEK